MFTQVKRKKAIRFLFCILTTISLCISNLGIEFYNGKEVHLILNNKAYAAEFDPAIESCPITAGSNHTLALMNDGTVKAWGYNSYGQLGLGDTVNRSTPTVISVLAGVKQIVAGDNHTLALMNDGTVKAWGFNNYGQLGLGDIVNRNTPTAISVLAGVKQVAAEGNHTIALMNDGTVKAWGSNSSGELGLGDTNDRNIPTVINGLTGVKQIVTGFSYAFALMNDGTVKAWGFNWHGELGMGDTTNRYTPTIINGLTGVKQIAAGSNHTMALMNDGTVKAWGTNSFGQLGLGDTTNRSTPTIINGLIGVKQISGGHSHTLALMNDETIKAWGYNYSGQLGLGDRIDRYTPITIHGLIGVKQVESGCYYTLALMNDETINAWGSNGNGQLGMGDTTIRYTPTVINGMQLNAKPNLSIQTPLSGYKFTTTQENFVPTITVSDIDNDTLSCKYYSSTEKNPRESKTLFNTNIQQVVSFSPVNLNIMDDGSYTIKFEVSDGKETVQQEVNFFIDRQTPSISNVTYSSNTTNIAVEGTVLNSYSYRYTIGTTSTEWIMDTSYTWKGLNSNTPYIVKLEAKDNEGNIVADQKTIYTKALLPMVSIGSADKTSVDIYIDDLNPSSIEYQIVSGTKYVTSTGTLTSTSTWITIPDKVLKITGLIPNLKYTFKAKARNGEGIETAYSAPIEINTLTDPPSCPTGLVADLIKISNSSVVLIWDGVTTATGYDIEADGIIKSTTGTSFKHIGLSPNTQHTYRVRAKNIYGVSEWSPIVIAMTTFNVPGYMTNISTYAENNLITLTWEDVPNAEYYEIEFDGDIINNGPNAFSTKVGLAPNSQHSYRVRAVNAAGEGQWSSIASATTYPIGTPKNIKIEEEEYAVALSWDSVKDATSYEIQANGQLIATVTNTKYKHINLNSETQYIYKIKAIGPQCEGGFCNDISIYTLPVKPNIPENITASVTNNVVTLTWNPVDTAIGYDVELDGVLIDNGNSTTYIHEELLKSTNHMYRIRAKNEAIEGDWSELLKLKTMQGKPTSPGNIKVSTTPTITTLTWDAQDDALSYDIEVDGQVADNISKTSYRHRRITPLTEHVYRIRTRNITGISPWSGYMINNSIKSVCKKGKDVDLGLTASDIIDFSKYILTVTYNKDVLDVTNLCTFSSKVELTKGLIDGTGITITEYTPGKIVFVVDKSIPPGESWTGVINSIKFRAKESGGTNITYTVFSRPEE